MAVVGPGAIGGLIAASLRRSGHKVTVVARDAHAAARLRRRGISVTSRSGRTRTFRSGLEAVSRLRPGSGWRAVFFCVKSPGIRRAIAAARPGVGPETVVVSLLNGLSHVRPLRAAFGRARTVFGSCYVASLRTGPAALRHRGGDRIHLAATPANRDAAGTAASILASAGWRIRTTPHEERLLWTKLAYNAAVNPLGALLNMTNRELVEDPAIRELLSAAAKEAAVIARAAGHRPLVPRLEDRVLRDCRAVPRQYCSMAQDLAAGRVTEADSILKPLLAAARRTGTPAPLLAPLYRMVKRLERSLR
ncbi:ketopantoate reductase family protein [Elusimicrobiota bacterium]